MEIIYFKDCSYKNKSLVGGGVRSMNDAYLYKLHGAHHFSASSVFFNPIIASNLYYQYLFRR